MTDTRTFSSSSSTTSTTNHLNGNPPSSSLSSSTDLNDVNNLTAYINTIFRQMEEKFSVASEQVMTRMNELGQRIDTLETNLNEIITSLPVEQSTVPTPSPGIATQRPKKS